MVERSGFEYMRARAGQFDDHFVRRKMWTRVGIDESEWGKEGWGKCARGREGGRGKEEHVGSAPARKSRQVEGTHGAARFATYDDFRDAVRSSAT